MEIPNEVTNQKAASAGFTWAITWRFLVLSFGIGWLAQYLPLTQMMKGLGLWPTIVIQLVATFIAYWVVTHWVLKKGFGSIKIVLLEQAHYQQIAKQLSNDE